MRLCQMRSFKPAATAPSATLDEAFCLSIVERHAKRSRPHDSPAARQLPKRPCRPLPGNDSRDWIGKILQQFGKRKSFRREGRRANVRWLSPSCRATSVAVAFPCGSNGAIAFSTADWNEPRFLFRRARASSQYEISRLLRYGSALTIREFLMLTGNTTSSTGAPNSMLSPKISASSAFVVLWWTSRTRSGTTRNPVS